MIDKGIKASFALGGITSHMVKLHQEGLIGRLIDVQSFDKVAAESLMNDPLHKSVSANEYAAMLEPGSATHFLDVVILSALEVDVNFNVNVLVGPLAPRVSNSCCPGCSGYRGCGRFPLHRPSSGRCR